MQVNKLLTSLSLVVGLTLGGLGYAQANQVEMPEGWIVKPQSGNGDALPNLTVNNYSVSNTSLANALRVLFEGTGIGFSVTSNSGQANQLMANNVSVYGMNGSLNDVLASLSEQAGFFYSYNSNSKTLKVYPDRSFVAKIPPLDKMYEGILETTRGLGASSVILDRPSGSIMYSASRNSADRVEAYLKGLRSTINLIEYDVSIYKVRLNNGSSLGIQWNNLGKRFNDAAASNGGISMSNVATNALENAANFTAIWNNKLFSLNVLLTFLKENGEITTVSQPKIMVNSGDSGMITVGQTTNYVSQVGSTVSNNTTTVSASTASELSGLELSIGGNVYDSTVFTTLSLGISDIVKFNDFTAVGTTLKLPQTTREKLKTSIQSESGDAIVIGGLTSKNSSTEKRGLPMFGGLMPLSSNKSQSQDELVIVLRPRVVKFDNLGGLNDAQFNKTVEAKPSDAVRKAASEDLIAKIKDSAKSEEKTGPKNSTEPRSFNPLLGY